MTNIRKTLEMTGLMFAMAMLFSYIGWALGYDGFIIVGDIDMPYWLLYVISLILLAINLSLYAGFVLKLYTWQVLYFSIPMTIISGIGSNFTYAEIFTGVIPIIVFLVAIIYYKLGKQAFKRLIIVNVSSIAWQWVMSKVGDLDLTVYVSAYQGFRLSINAILLILLLYLIGGVSNANRLEHLVFPGGRDSKRDRDESRPSSTENSESLPVNQFEKGVMTVAVIFVQILQWMFILWVCSLDNLFLDALVMTTSFICHGMIISKRKHIKQIILCTLAATIMFYFSARFTISFQYAQFFTIVIGLAQVYIVYRISYQFEKDAKEKRKKDIERVRALEQQMDKAWEQIDKIY